ncbi:MAG: TIGR02186 family protein [Pseudomonadota bacterium]
MRLLLALMFSLCALASAANETIVADLSQRRVAITTNFSGSEILIFGAVRRDGPRTSLSPLDVIITVAGPPSPVTVRKKDRVAGIWVNADEAEIDSAPSFYAVLSSKPISDLISETEDLRHRITTPQVIRAVDVGAESGADTFVDALIRIRRNEGTYQLAENSVGMLDGTLFRATVGLPANLTEGAYETTMYLVRDREIVSKYVTAIDVQKVGLEQFLYGLAHNQPLIYGIMSLVIAISAGWLASAAFTFLRR